MHDYGYMNKGETKKTSTMTFRIDDKVLKILRDESELQQGTLNNFINQLLKHFVK